MGLRPSLAGIIGSKPAGGRCIFSCEYYVLSRRGLWDGPITRYEKSSERGVYGCDREASTRRRLWPAMGCCAMENSVSSSSIF